jgi:hypothetical protein
MMCAQSLAQPPAFELTGTNQLSAQTANRQGSYQEQPTQFWRWEFEPTVQVYGIPLSFYVLLSSEQQEFRQNINALTSMFTPERLRQRIADRLTSELQSLSTYADVSALADRYEAIKDSLANANPMQLERLEAYRTLKQLEALKDANPMEHLAALQQLGIVSDIERIMLYLPQVQVGMVYPTYSSLVLRGVAMNGGSIEWTPGTFLFSFAGGRTRRPILRPDSINMSSYGQELYAARIGFGYGTATSLTISALSAHDQGGWPLDTSRPLQGNPYATHVVGIQFNTSVWDQRLTLDGELAASLVTWDTQSPRPTEDQLPNWLVRMFDLRLSSSLDVAYNARLSVQLPETSSRLAVSSRMVGPGFFTYGNPLLRRDVIAHEARLDQTLFRRVLSVGLTYRIERDNLLGTKFATTMTNAYTASISIAPRFLPFVRISGTYATQSSNYGTQQTVLWQAGTGYSYQLGTLGAFTTLSVSEQRTSGWTPESGLRTAMLDQSMSFPFPLTIGLSLQAGFPVFATDTLNHQNWMATVTASYTLWEQLTVTLAPNISSADNAVRILANARIQLDLKKWGMFRVELTSNRFRNQLQSQSNFDETLLRASFEQRW